MRLFEETQRPQDAAAMMTALVMEFKELEHEPPSRCISPSSLNCQVFGAWKLRGVPTTPQKESFQSRGFADAGTDRHERIQNFLKTTPYWVNVSDYVKAKKLPLEIVEEQGNEVLLYSKEYEARFKCDGMLFIDGNYYVLEIKTERQAANDTRTGPNDKHQKQGIFYSLVMKTDRIMWLYEGRDFLVQKFFVQLVDTDQKKQIAKYVKDIIKYKEEPEKLSKFEKNCPGCMYKNYCKMYFKELKKKEMLEKCQK